MNETTNYIFQKRNYNSYQCAAYAIYNLLKAEGIDSIKLRPLIRTCKARKNIGTLVKDFNSTIETLQNKITIKPLKADIKSIKKFASPRLASPRLASPRLASPIIILFHWYQGSHKGNHYALIDQINYKYGSYTYRVINYSFDKPVNIISERELKSMLMPYKDEHFELPLIWIVN